MGGEVTEETESECLVESLATFPYELCVMKASEAANGYQVTKQLLLPLPQSSERLDLRSELCHTSVYILFWRPAIFTFMLY